MNKLEFIIETEDVITDKLHTILGGNNEEGDILDCKTGKITFCVKGNPDEGDEPDELI